MTAEVTPKDAAPAPPDYATDPDAVLKDDVKWRFGRPPSYAKTREFYAQGGKRPYRQLTPGKSRSHEPGSLPSIVENIVKNWEIEASYKPDLSDWRTIDQSCYTFSLNGGPPNTGEIMTKVGTYNALLSASQFYDPAHNNFTASHKTFKRMMPVFAWEVLEVYSGPPDVAFRWRHWGEMKNDYVGINRDGKKVRVKAHGGILSIEGMLVAKVNDKLQIQHIDTWYDPMALFDEVMKNGGELVVEEAEQGEIEASKCPFAAAAL